MKARKDPAKVGFVRKYGLFIDLALILLLCAVNVYWYLPLREMGVISGDDIGFVLGSRAITPIPGAFAQISDFKYRPLVLLLSSLETRLCGSNYGAYFMVNLAVQCLLTALLYRLLLQISKRRAVAFPLSLMFAVCPFVYYNITQVFGIMEAECIFFLLFTVEFGLKFFRSGKTLPFFLTLLFLTLLVFTHERFLSLPPVFFIGVLLCDRLSRPKKWTLAVLSLFPLVLNIAVKLAMGLTLLIGTAHTPVNLSVATVAGFVYEGLMSILGVNIGEAHLRGYTYDQYTLLEQRFAWAVFALSVLALVVCVIRALAQKKPKKKARELKGILLGVLAVGATLFSGCVAIRLESRWLLAPFVCMLLLLSHCLRRIKWLHLGEIAAIAIFALSAVINFHYRSEAGQIYFMRSMKQAQSIWNATIGQYGENLSDYELCFVTEDDQLMWAIGAQEESMFDVYLEHPPKWRYATAQDAVEPSDTLRVFKLDERNEVIEVRPMEGYRLLYDLNDWQRSQVVVPDTHADTPNGQGAFFLNGSLTVLSGYRDRIEGLNVPENAAVILSACIPYEESDGAQVMLYFTEGDKMLSVCVLDIFPGIDIENRRFPIDRAMTNASLTIGVTSPSGNKSADWVVFSDLRVLAGAEEQN